MDFGVWGNANGNMDQTNSQNQQTENQPNNSSNQSKGNSTNGAGNNGNLSNENGVVLMHHMEHPGVVCDICDTTICGFRYKCMQCPDFDLCHFCERKGHHAGHIMMRISFPEQAADAIRRYINNGGESPSPRPHRPTPFCGGSPKDWNPSVFPPFGGHKRGDRHSSRHRHHGRVRDSSPENDAEESPAGAGVGQGCPYQMSKKGIKKWTKYMKKAAHHHRRSAEAYAQSATRENGGNPAPESAQSAAPNSFDYTFAASQIQEFLNAWGVPIDVVELYDEFGNRSQRPSSGPSNDSNANKNAGGDQNQSKTATEKQGTDTSTEKQTPGTLAETQAPAAAVNQGVLSDQLQQLTIDNHGDNVINDANRPATTVPAATAPSMDIDGMAGWTLIDKDYSNSVAPVSVENSVTEDLRSTGRVTFDLPNPEADSLPKNLGNGNEANQPEPRGIQLPQTPLPNFTSPIQEPLGPSTTTPAGVPVNTLPMYPVLNAMQNPQFQQMMQGVTNAVGSAIRSIPMVPMGMGGFPRPQQPGQQQQPNSVPLAPKSEESGNSIPELDANCVTTLNQLLSMGFSNHDGWLARLVVAKKGDLEAVLNALFPGGAP